MIISIKYIKGKTFLIDIEQTDTIRIIKEKIKLMEGISIDKQKLIFAGFILNDDKPVNHYNIQRSTTIYLVY